MNCVLYIAKPLADGVAPFFFQDRPLDTYRSPMGLPRRFQDEISANPSDACRILRGSALCTALRQRLGAARLMASIWVVHRRSYPSVPPRQTSVMKETHAREDDSLRSERPPWSSRGGTAPVPCVLYLSRSLARTRALRPNFSRTFSRTSSIWAPRVGASSSKSDF